MKQPISITRYNAHKAHATKRGIDFLLTYQEWYDWWLKNGIDKEGPTQGKRTKDTLCMCRFGDTGPYSLNNIYCGTVSQNSKDIDKYKHKFARKKVQTPLGTFNSVTDAAQAHNVPIWKMSELMRSSSKYQFL